MTRRAVDLEARLTEWGKEYGGGKYGLHASVEDGTVTAASYGNSPLASLMRWHGRPPDGLGQGISSDTTAADEVQAAVSSLALQQHGHMPAQVIRCEYFLPGQPKESKLSRLRRIGCGMSSVRYSQHLRIARIHVAAWLRLPFSEPLTDDEAARMLEYMLD